MKIGILGSGDVAQALGRGFAAKGHEVKLGTRESKKLEAWAKEVGAKGSVGTFSDAAKHGEVVILATLGTGTESALDMAGPSNFRGKLVIDATNALDYSKGMPPGLFVGTTDSLGERVQRKLPDAKVVKAFNTVGNPRMLNPPADARMMVAGDDAQAKQRVEALLKQHGWAGILDCGGIDAARWLEASVPLWVRFGMANNRWDHIPEFR
jgi:hypothetical protein